MMLPKKIIFTFISIFFAWTSPTLGDDRVSVFVSIAPQAEFVQQIGKERVDVHVLVEPGADPHTYEPRPQQLAALARARLYFAVGVEFEKARLPKIRAMNPKLRIVDTDQDILKRPMVDPVHPGDDHHHDHHAGVDGHEHDHTGIDPHIWLSPPLVMLQARTILTALQAEDPAHRSIYEANYRDFILTLVDLDADLRRLFQGLDKSAFMVFHPSWGTFAHTYGLRQLPIEIDGKQPKPAQLKQLIEYARSRQIKVVFVQPQFSAKSAQQIAGAIDGRVVVVDPLAADWAANLRRTAEEFRHALK